MAPEICEVFSLKLWEHDRSHVYNFMAVAKKDGSSGSNLFASWFVSKAPAYIWLVNDGLENLEFREMHFSGETVARVKLEPKDRKWMKTKLGSAWLATLSNGTVVGTKKVRT